MIIPLYNAEEYIGECLDSILAQTFQNFEVIVVDDCSTDNSVAVVNAYAPRFGGRLTLTRTQKNSGGGGYVPRNIGLNFSWGEYVFFLDADDFIARNSLQTLYAAAKQFNADVIYTGVYYSYGNDKKAELILDGDSKLAKEKKLPDKPSMIVDAPNKLVQHLLFGGDFLNPWTKFVKRAFLIENEIVFPKIISGGDFIWCIKVSCHAKRFLRLPIACYFYRNYSAESVWRKKRAPKEQLVHYLSAFDAWAKALVKLENKTELLKQNPQYCYQACVKHFGNCMDNIFQERMQMNPQKLYEILHREFVKEPSDFTMSFLFSVVDTQQRNLLAARQQFNQFAAQAQSRITKLEAELKQLKSKE